MSDSNSAVDRIRPMTGADLTLVLQWRNHPDVRHNMFTQHEIGLEEHIAWFERSARDPSRHLLIYEKEELPLGFVGLTMSGHPHVADWGFYVAPEAPKGTGRAMGRHALDHAFDALGLHKVFGRAIAYNQPSISFHAAMGFRQEGILRDQYFDGQRYHAVVCFGLLEYEWSSASRG
ncbi:UDP-4-amino-4,6-dideoxy-N-acetyl-beta-L-altrosamine N-acetyltransferase [Variovorax sp. J22G21]|uniref:UDP-4-amino-4, 6-dideoxy-N-acetyl-beta-L-altrosamine N-acetyltransferase n=1 Tax=Variovorax fucosicus TaxID=3053517 RepID=UPI002574EA04|nr:MULTISPECIES: UDP-4-amino-4,6-dideoxy-N-acetyl-beta-L-altrosamine N-acetyltransferase [unclassified Variovorax]MDM0039462.1 UDP-4-amino-4,6-dideoxy-N-acetyl-beta-L-altrosamine N-acetyltransferase [Variovorax sp. J22R193]MDM0064237.1 UDP-4-amino-4,6-dideoxy-N-acetyl-beta-L-altrosamine N-acetyltransferase [Variovorax sp. J22G21]